MAFFFQDAEFEGAKPYFIQSAVNKGLTPLEAEYVFNDTKWHSSRTKTVFPPDYAGDPTLEVTYRAIAYGLTEGDLYAIDLQRQAQSIQMALDYNAVQIAAISVSRYNNTGTGTGASIDTDASTGAGSPAKPPAGVKGAGKVPSASTKIVTVETKAPTAMKASGATKAWDDFLGSNQTSTHTVTGAQSADRIFSADGTKSIRFSRHEMNSMGTPKGHFHFETWIYDPVTDTMTVNNLLQRVIP